VTADRPATASQTLSPWQALRSDLDRYGSHFLLRDLSVYAVIVYRFGQWTDSLSGVARLAFGRVYWLLHRMAISLIHIELPKEALFGPGLRFHHCGPVVVHPGVRAGSGCTIRQGVTLGEGTPGGGVPNLGDRVDLGAFCQVLGNVSIGNGAKIGALALVLDDVPPQGTAFGPRAQVRPTRD
jgi:serine O-acetyltransferase